MITVTGPKSIAIPASMGGNDATFQLVQVAASRGLLVEQHGNGVRVAGITDTELLSIAIVQMLVAAGCDVLGYPVFFEFNDPEDICPLFETPVKWGEAFGELHRPFPAGGRWFQKNELTNHEENDGEPLPASKWINADVTLRTVAEVHAILNELAKP